MAIYKISNLILQLAPKSYADSPAEVNPAAKQAHA